MGSNVDVLLDRQGVADFCGLSIETIKQYRSDGVMPEPDHLVGTEQKPMWKPSTITKWRKGFRDYKRKDDADE